MLKTTFIGLDVNAKTVTAATLNLTSFTLTDFE